jgi:L-lactate dehydrogenase complex protein LldG
VICPRCRLRRSVNGGRVVTSGREAILARVRASLADVPSFVAPSRDYRLRGERDAAAVIELFVERVRDYEATVVVTGDPGAAVAAALTEADARCVAIAVDLARELRAPGVELVEDLGLGSRDLDALDGAVTTCAVACAETGTIALDGGPGQGRRALSLVPDLHVCVVRAEAIVETVPELIAALEPSAREGRPIVLVSGPSATSDIELTRVEGVHGPRRLVVVVAT